MVKTVVPELAVVRRINTVDFDSSIRSQIKRIDIVGFSSSIGQEV